jgi:hypothetical protein
MRLSFGRARDRCQAFDARWKDGRPHRLRIPVKEKLRSGSANAPLHGPMPQRVSGCANCQSSTTWVECLSNTSGHFPRDHTVLGFSAASVRNPILHPSDDAIAMRNVRKSVSSMAMNRNGCNPIGTAEHGLSSSAMPSTGPAWVQNITSITAPGLSGLRTRSKPPVVEMV